MLSAVQNISDIFNKNISLMIIRNSDILSFRFLAILLTKLNI